MINMEQEVKLIWGYKNKNHYINKGYEDRKIGEEFYPKLIDVTYGAHCQVEVICDYCGQYYYPKYYDYIKKKNRNKTNLKDCCSQCRKFKLKEYHNNTLETRADEAFLRLNKLMKENNYTLLTKKEEYDGIYMQIKYICPKHGVVSGELNRLINEHCFCNLCGNDKISQSKRLSKDKVINIINSVNNNTLLNPEDYIGNKYNNLKIKCNCGRIFYASITTYQHGKNICSVCRKSESAGEQRVRQWLEDHNIKYRTEYIYNDCRDIKPLPFDFYLPQYNTIIEYDGQQHFKPWLGQESFDKTVYHDNIKNQYCIDHNITLIRIPYTKFTHIDNILTKELLNT